MTDLIDTVQKTALDDAFIELFDINLKYKNNQGATVTELIHLVDGLDADQSNLYFPYPSGSDNRTFEQYLATPIGLEGFSITSSGAQSRPNLTVANVASLARSITDNSNTDSTANETTIDTIQKVI